ncbi:iron ABC transporter permease [Helicobacter enhydrae]|uniref:Iron ABC transporter permease n=1 Tax=Helicobacter enhydrae TaxID=222136 RepID=A0A1B1U4Z7_9HELI|nr:iron ABC transporter permease [Helicobacter enhydrae]ANV97829.1 iron ABC transporter permease [Helicobacter enhydrae]
MRIIFQCLALLIVGIVAVPIFGTFVETCYVFLQSLQQDSSLALEIQSNLKHFFTFLFGRFLADSFIVVFCVLLLSALIGTTCAYLVAHYRFFGSKILDKILFLPLAIPSYILAFAYVGLLDFSGIFYEILGLRVDIFNLGGVIFVLTFSLFPYVYLFAKDAFQTESTTLYEVAQTMKCSQWQIFYKVSLPLAKPAILSGLLLVLMETLSDYGASAYLGVDTFSAGIFKLWYDLSDPYSASILTAILMLFVLGLMQVEQKLKNRQKYSSNQNCKLLINPKPLPPIPSLLASCFCSLIATLGFFLPLFWLLYWGLQDSKLFEKDFYLLALNSLHVGILSACFALICALFLCFVIRITRQTFLRNLLTQTSTLGYAIPGAVVGVSMMILATAISNLTNIPLLGTSISLLVFAYIVRFLATAIYSIQNGYDKIHACLDEASLSLRSGYIRLWFKIHLPLLKHFILSALLVVFIDTIKELPTTRMLAPFGFETLSTKAFWYATDERLYNSALPSLLIVLLSLLSMLIINLWIRKDDARD